MSITFSQITTRADAALVVGSASSLVGFDFCSVLPLIERGVRVITANNSLFDCPCTDWTSCHIEDYVNRREVTADTLPHVTKYAPVDEHFGTERANTAAKRLPPADFPVYLHNRVVPDTEPPNTYEWDNPSFCYNGNTGFTAFQIALKMGAKRIGIIGIDAKQSGYYKPDPFDLHDTYAHVPALFKRTLPFTEQTGVEVFYGSPNGALPYGKMSPQDVVFSLI